MAKRKPSTFENWLSGPGVSSFSGRQHIQPQQVGFAVKLTSTYDSTTGYSWERLVLEPPITDGTSPLTGAYAFTIDDNQTLAVDQTGWLEPAQEATGYIFQPTTAASSGLTYDDYESVSNYLTLAADDTFADTLIEVTLPSAGTYLILPVCTTSINASAGTMGVGVQARIYDVTNSVSAPLNDTGDQVDVGVFTVIGVRQRTTTAWSFLYTVSGSTVLRMQASCASGVTVTGGGADECRVRYDGGFTRMTYIKLS